MGLRTYHNHVEWHFPASQAYVARRQKMFAHQNRLGQGFIWRCLTCIRQDFTFSKVKLKIRSCQVLKALIRSKKVQSRHINPTRGRGGIAFLAPFCYPIDPKKFDFSQISMTMPPILSQRLQTLDLEMWFFAFFGAKMTKIEIKNLKLIVTNDYQ